MICHVTLKLGTTRPEGLKLVSSCVEYGGKVR